MNMFTQNNRKDAINLFAKGDDNVSLYLGNLSYLTTDLFGNKQPVTGYDNIAAKLEEMAAAEKENGYDFISVPVTTTPYIAVNEDGTEAVGMWMVQTVDVKATYYGCDYNSLYSDVENKTKDENAMIPVVRSICLARQNFVKQDGTWKIKTYNVEPLMTLPVDEYRWSNLAGFGHHAMQNSNAETSFPYIKLDDEWDTVDDDYDYQLANAQDTMELQGFISRWANVNKRRETVFFLDNLMPSTNPRLYTFMKNSSANPTIGYEGVYKFMFRQTQNWNETLSIGHSGTTPLIYTYTDSEGTEHAIGFWIDHSWTNLAQIFGTPVTDDTISFMLNVNRYRHEFIKENGEWKMLGFGFEPLIEIPKWTLEWKSCRGWGSLGLGAFTETDMDLAYPTAFDLIDDDTADDYFSAITGVYKVKLNKDDVNLNQGETFEAEASVYPFNARPQEITWTSSDETVATVDANGKVTAVANGHATITASVEDVSADLKVRVGDEAALKIQMEETEGKFVRYYTNNELGKIADELFADSENTSLVLPDKNLKLTGTKAIKEALLKWQEERAASPAKEVHLLATPYYEVNDDLTSGLATWDTYTYTVDKDAKTCEIEMTHFDVTFVPVDGEMKIDTMDWHIMQSWVPWNYTDEQFEEVAAQLDALKIAEGTDYDTANTGSSDFLKIQKLQNYFFENNMNEVDDLFADSEDATFAMGNLFDETVTGKAAISQKLADLKAAETANKGMYLAMGLCTTPVIAVAADGKTATGDYLVQTFEIKGANYGDTEEPYTLVRHISELKADYVKTEDGAWKIQNFDMDVILTLPDSDYSTHMIFWDKSGEDPNWSFDNAPLPGDYPKDSFDIENLVNEWIYCLRRGELHNFVQKHFPIHGEGVPFSFFLRSNPQRTPITEAEALVNQVTGMDAGLVTSQPSYHTATTPIVEISADGKKATATWMEHSLTNLGQAQIPGIPQSEEGKPNYMIFTGKYFHEFTKINGEWFVTSFNWEPMMSLPIWQFDPTTSKGWAASGSTQKFPFPKEKYESNVVNKVTLDKESASIGVGETLTLEAAVAPENVLNKNVVWTSSDPAVATVDAKGVVTAVKEGTATITAKSAMTDASASCEITVTKSAEPAVLAAPVVKAAQKDKGISLSWKKVANADGYVVYRKAGKATKWTEYAKVAASKVSFLDAKTTNGTKYTYKVAAVASDGTTKDSKEVVMVRLTKITGVKAKKQGANAIKVTYKKNKKASGYQVRYGTGKKTKTVTVKGAKKVSTVLKKLKKGKTYKITVRAYKTVSGKKYYSVWSAAKSVKR